MNFLNICKRVVQEAGISGAGPTTVVSQTGMLKKVVDWSAQAWLDLQLARPNWLFMHSEFQFNTTANIRDYLAADVSITNLKLWDTGSFLIYETAVGESDQNPLQFLSYDKWRSQYRNQMNVRINERPQLFTILPTNKVRFEPRPDKIYTINGDYRKTAQTMSLDADVPTNLPDDFHMMIVWGAVWYYAFYEDAPELLEVAEGAYDLLLDRLEIEQLPAFNTTYEALA